MEALFIYIAKSAGLVVMFYCVYHFLLRKETFFNTNRWFLLAGLGTSALLPFLFYTKTILVNPTPVSNFNLSQIKVPLSQNIPNETFEINWNYVLLAVYGLGFFILLIKFALDFYSLQSVLKGKKIQQQADFKFIDTNENIAPFSYFEYIVYNSSMYTSSELENIIEHEKVHSDQNHTADILVARIFCLLFWFNPVIWLYKKAIAQNLEFIADKEAAKKLSDKRAYQYTLLKITTHESCIAITNHFYQSLIKKRIVMLNKNQSRKRNSWKYYVVIPALAAFVLLFQVEVIAKERQVSKKEVLKESKSVDTYKITKTTTDQELKEIAENLKKKYDVVASISDVERNSNNEITAIRVAVKKGSEQNQTFMVNGSKAIKDCQIIVTTEDDGSIKIDFVSENLENQIKVVNKERKVKVKSVENSKINSDVKTTDNTHTSVTTSSSTNTSDNINVNVNANTNTSVSVSTNSDGKSNSSIMILRNGTNVSNNLPPLVIVDGTITKNIVTIDDMNKLKMETVTVLTGKNAIKKYGEEAKDGVVIIETKK
ncbi:M56 family metallopeptidase [Flavobacterium sp. 2]|uniref:M56 family metallopeptidase n=1 Tax=Flavobacterium sp. 2 TaxID=308053 RepID=UPI003CF56090